MGEPARKRDQFNNKNSQAEAEKDTDESGQKFQSIFEQSPLGILINDMNHRPVLANNNYLRMLGYTYDELKKLNISEYTNPEDYPKEMELDHKLHAGEINTYSLEKRYIAKGGHTIWVQLSASLLKSAEGKPQYHLRMVEDITKRRKTEEALQKTKSALGAETKKFNAILNSIRDYVFAFDLNNRFVYANKVLLELWGRTEEDAIGKTMAELNYPEETKSDLLKGINHVKVTKSAWKSQVGYYTYKGKRTYYEYLLSPVLDSNGNLILVAGSSRDITERKKVEEEIRQKTSQLQTVLDTMAEGVGLWRADGTLIDMNNANAKIHGYSNKEEISRHLGDFVDVEIRSLDGRKLPMDEWPVPRLIRGEQFHDLVQVVYMPATHKRFIGSYSGAIIFDENGDIALGVLTLHDVTELYDRQKELTIERKQAQRELKTTKALLEAAAKLSEWTDLDHILNSLSNIIFKYTNVERIFINLIDTDKQILIPKIATGGLKAPTTGEPVPLSKLSQTSQRAIIKQKTMILDYEDPQTPEYDKDIAKANNSKLVLFIPLLYQNKIIGHISVDEPGKRRKFSKREIQVLEGIASQAAVAIENARLYEVERHIADTLQEAIIKIPQKIEGILFGHIYRSATEAAKVGGDFYDIFEMENQRIGIILGDVSGKGVKAATLTSLVRNTLQAYLFQGDAPETAMAKVNTITYSTTKATSFITLICGVLNIRNRHFTYCNAGHPPGLLKIARNISELRCESTALGAFSEAKFSQTIVRIPENGMMIFYTDGVIEARDNERRFFGEQGLLQAAKAEVSTEQMPGNILGEVLRFTGGKLQDDLAILTVSLEKDH